MNTIKRSLAVLLLLCMTAGLLGSAAWADSEGTVTASVLNLRSEASTSSSVIGTLYQGETVTVTESLDGWYKISRNGQSGYVSADYLRVSSEATVSGSDVNLRSSASTSSSVIACVAKGTSVTVLGTEGDWYKVSYQGQTAYIKKDYVSTGSGSSSSSSSSGSSSSAQTGTISGSYVRFRSAASTSSSILATFDKGASVTVNGSEGDWYKVSCNGRDGYVYKSYVSLDGGSSSSSSASPSGKEGTITGSDVRFRSAASTSSSILGTFSRGNSVTVLGTEGDWYKVSCNGKDGYVYKSYVSLDGESSSGSSVSVSSASGTGTIRGTYVRVRSGASTSSSVLATVNTGTTMDITGTTGEWYQVKYKDQTGYVYKSYLLTEEEAAAAAATSSQSSSKGEALVVEAKKYLGVPYVYGGTSPSGFDCSGLVYYVYKQLGYSIYRTATAQYSNGVYVSRDELQPGDIIIFYNSGMSAIGHAGMYIGNGQFIHASSGGGKVQINNLTDYYYNTHYYGARRVV